ncbi:glycosyltransferase [Bacillus haimaensis]|uniref:glycosyltransferase n=1 Tax=Bacillus haimaensis TaxID=3160967 RepID=UPI003AA905E3
MKTKPFISIIFPVKNEGDNVKMTLDSLFSFPSKYQYEVIIVNDNSTDGCCSFLSYYDKKEKIKLIETTGIGSANARNVGAKDAQGEYLIFCDAHLTFEKEWIDKLIEPLITNKSDVVTPGIADMENPESIGYGQTLSPNMEIIWHTKQNSIFETAVIPGGCFVISKVVFEDVGGFETGFKTWGHEDVELSIKLWLFGYRCHVQTEVTIYHLFRRIHPYKVKPDDVYYNLLRLAFSHFNEVRIEKCKRIITQRKAKIIVPLVLQDGVLKQRELYIKKRKFSDDWYFRKFGIEF